MSGTSVVIAAGGTGGHIYPGVALAGALRRAEPDARITFVGTPRGLEGRVIPAAGYPLRLIDMIPFSRGLRSAILPIALVRATRQARSILKKEGADVAVGMGGYSSLPLIVAARLAGVPSLVHESGAIPGKANLVAARFTSRVAVAFQEAAGHFPKSLRTRYTGMPLNEEISGFDRSALRAEARRSMGLPEDPALLLVTGGSQGALRLNEAAVELAGRWKDRRDVRIVIKSGSAHAGTVQDALAANGGAAVATSVTYFERMDHAYAAADIVLCRAGAATVAELALTGLPAILVPYPFATSDHQAINARALVEAGGAVMLRDHEVSAERIGSLIDEWLSEPGALDRMSKAARSVAHPRAAEELASWVLEVAGTSGRTRDKKTS